MIVLTAFTGAAALLLLWAGVEHVRSPATAATQLRALTGGSARLARLAAVALALLEGLVAAAALYALVTHTAAGRWALAALGSLYLAFAGHLLVRYRRHDREDCGCARVGARVGTAGLIRAGLLGSVSLVAAIGYPRWTSQDQLFSYPSSVLVLTAAGTLAVLLYALPPAVDGLSTQSPLVRRHT